MATNLLIPNIVVSAAFCNTLYNLNTVAYTLINVDIYMNMDVYIDRMCVSRGLRLGII